MVAKRSYKKPAVKVNVNQKITDIIIEQLKGGTEPWKQQHIETDFPTLTRYHSGEPYKGINTILLSIAKHQHQLQSNGFLTFNQATEVAGIDKELMAQVRDKKNKDVTLDSINHPLAGQKSVGFVVFNSPVFKNEEGKRWGKKLPDGGYRSQPTQSEISAENIKVNWVSKTYAVWSIDQMAYIPENWHEKRNNAGKVVNQDMINGTQDERISSFVNSVIEKNGIKIVTGSGQPRYNIGSDCITMPKISDFVSDSSYMKTLLHELMHWSGSKDRLDRQFEKFSDGTATKKDLAMEELVAEIGSCFLSQKLGIDSVTVSSLENHTRYINSWIDVLGDNEKAIVFASSAAEKASDFLIKSLDLKLAIQNDENSFEP